MCKYLNRDFKGGTSDSNDLLCEVFAQELAEKKRIHSFSLLAPVRKILPSHTKSIKAEQIRSSSFKILVQTFNRKLSAQFFIMPDTSKLLEFTNKFIVEDGTTISLKDHDTDYDHKQLPKAEGEALLQLGIQKLSELQDKLYIHNQYSMLIVIQAMDAAGKDSVVKHVMSGLNPQGVKVHSFKVPTPQELAHDFLWRHCLVLPAKGEICIFNRSHYENVLVTKVHPEYILKENLQDIEKVEDIDQAFWEKRYKQINRFEKTWADNGMIILKFFLHVSKKEQKKRFIERIDDPAKNWKFSYADLKERARWKEYRKAYEEMLNNTSRSHAPWFIIPADDKWFTRLAVAGIIYQYMEKLNLSYPKLNEGQKAILAKAKEELMNENMKESNGVTEN